MYLAMESDENFAYLASNDALNLSLSLSKCLLFTEGIVKIRDAL